VIREPAVSRISRPPPEGGEGEQQLALGVARLGPAQRLLDRHQVARAERLRHPRAGGGIEVGGVEQRGDEVGVSDVDLDAGDPGPLQRGSGDRDALGVGGQPGMPDQLAARLHRLAASAPEWRAVEEHRPRVAEAERRR